VASGILLQNMLQGTTNLGSIYFESIENLCDVTSRVVQHTQEKMFRSDFEMPTSLTQGGSALKRTKAMGIGSRYQFP